MARVSKLSMFQQLFFLISFFSFKTKIMDSTFIFFLVFTWFRRHSILHLKNPPSSGFKKYFQSCACCSPLVGTLYSCIWHKSLALLITWFGNKCSLASLVYVAWPAFIHNTSSHNHSLEQGRLCFWFFVVSFFNWVAECSWFLLNDEKKFVQIAQMFKFNA